MKRIRLLLLLMAAAYEVACGANPTSAPLSPSLPPHTAASAEASPAPSAIPASPTPALPVLTKLTEPGCCADPGWSADSKMVTFVDKPAGSDQAGIYGVPITGGPEQLISAQVGQLNADGKYLAFLDGKNETVIRRLDGSTDQIIDDGGQRPVISPGDKRLAWVFSTQVDVVIGTRVDIVVADMDGGSQQPILTVYDGGIAGWLDDDHLLVVGRKSASPGDLYLFSLDVTSGAQVDLVHETRMRDIAIAPGGKWVSYAVTFDTRQPPDDGLWVVSADGQTKTRLPVAGAMQWRDDYRLLVIPLDIGAASHRLWQLDTRTGEGFYLTDLMRTSFRIEGGEWSVSPDGTMMVFLNEADHALWLMRLPDSLLKPS